MLGPARNDIDIWLVDDREVADDTLLNAYRDMLNDEETGRHQRFIFTRHRHQFLVARALVRSALGKYLGMAPAAVAFTRNGHGKPLLAGDVPLQFNLTHTNGLIALAVTRQDTVGIDVEYLSRQADIVNLAQRYFSPLETQALYDLPVQAWNQRFYDLWTLKEAYLKACGTGLSTPLRDFSFSFGPAGVEVSFTGAIDDDPANWRFWLLDVPGAFRLALAVHDRDGTDYSLNVRKGIPLGDFAPVELVAVDLIA